MGRAERDGGEIRDEKRDSCDISCNGCGGHKMGAIIALLGLGDVVRTA